jgi:hypothetical protein
MRKSIFLCFFLTLSIITTSQEINLREQIKILVTELESKYTDRPGIKIALLEFRTSENKLVPFNNFCRDEIAKNLQNSTNFKLIDLNISATIAKEKQWNNDVSNNFGFFDDLGRSFMEKSGYVPVAYLYGIISDNDESITITAYLSPSGLSEAKSVSTITFDASEKTDKLLGKAITHVKKQPTTEVETTSQNTNKQSSNDKPSQSNNYTSITSGNFTIKITEVKYSFQTMIFNFIITNNNGTDEDLTIYNNYSRFFDSAGNEYIFEDISLGASKSDYSVYNSLAPNIPLKGSATYYKVPENADVALLELQLNNNKVTFKNLFVRK